MVGEDAIDSTLCGGIADMLGVEVARGLLGPVPIEHVAVIVAIVAVYHLLVVLVPEPDAYALGLEVLGQLVEVVHCKVHHAIEVHDVGYVGVYGLELVERRVHRLLDVAPRPLLDRVRGATLSVPLFDGDHLVMLAEDFYRLLVVHAGFVGAMKG